MNVILQATTIVNNGASSNFDLSIDGPLACVVSPSFAGGFHLRLRNTGADIRVVWLFYASLGVWSVRPSSALAPSRLCGTSFPMTRSSSTVSPYLHHNPITVFLFPQPPLRTRASNIWNAIPLWLSQYRPAVDGICEITRVGTLVDEPKSRLLTMMPRLGKLV